MEKKEDNIMDDFWNKFCSFYHAPLIPMSDIPVPNHYGAYMQKRKHSVHTGIDLYAPEGSNVFAIESGRVVLKRIFTGPQDGTPWWNETWAVYIHGDTGTMCYGEILPESNIKEGIMVEGGQKIGTVIPVLKNDKGKATSMLHFALHSHGFELMIQHNDLNDDARFYELQQDPTLLLMQCKAKADRC